MTAGVHTPIPADFAAIAGGVVNRELMKRYGVSRDTISRWRTITGTKARVATPMRALPDDFAQLAARMTANALMNHYHANQDIIRRWAKESGCQPQRAAIGRPRLAAHYGRHKHYVIDSRDGSLLTRAQSFLQRFGPVFRCREDGRPDPRGACFMVWGRVRSGDDVLAMAERKGFDADGWKRVA